MRESLFCGKRLDMPKPNNPYREGTLIWAVMEGDWEDLAAAQIAEVLNTDAHAVRAAISRIEKKTGYVVPHMKGKPGRPPKE